MSIEEMISRMEFVACAIDGKKGAKVLCGSLDAKAIRSAVSLLRTHPAAQPNEPLTLDELRKMEGWPVWTVTKGISGSGRWELVIDAECEDRLEMVDRADGFYEIDTDSYGKTWLAYFRPPKELPSTASPPMRIPGWSRRKSRSYAPMMLPRLQSSFGT